MYNPLEQIPPRAALASQWYNENKHCEEDSKEGPLKKK